MTTVEAFYRVTFQTLNVKDSKISNKKKVKADSSRWSCDHHHQHEII